MGSRETVSIEGKGPLVARIGDVYVHSMFRIVKNLNIDVLFWNVTHRSMQTWKIADREEICSIAYQSWGSNDENSGSNFHIGFK